MADVIGDVAGKLTEQIFSGVLIFGLVAIGLMVVGGIMWYFLFHKKKYDIIVRIISERASDKDSIIFDKAAILIDRKTRTKYFKLWNNKTELPCPPFNILQRTSKGDYLELRRTAEDRWYFLRPAQINKKEIMKADGKIYPVSSQKALMIDPSMDFWNAKRKSQNRGMFDPEKIWMKILPFLPYILGGFFIVFILYILMSYLPGVLSALQDLTQELNRGRAANIVTGIVLPLIG